QFIVNAEEHYRQWRFTTLMEAFANHHGLELRAARKLTKSNPEKLDEFVMAHPENVVRLARPDYNSVSEAARNLIDASRDSPETVMRLTRKKYSDMYFLRGERILFYKNKLKLIDGEYVAGEPLTTLWDDLLSNNLHNEGGVKFPKGKKPEALLKRVIELSTEPNDLVLDSFAGSGTTGAVAHKMGRRWIMVELGEHCQSHIRPRMKSVIDGEDASGVTQAVGWKGGGGYRYYKLGPTLIVEDEWGNPVINPEFNAGMLAAAMCKLEGFTFDPNPDVYWQQGRSSEADFIYVTTQFMSTDMLTKISDEVGQNRSLLICCSAFRCDPTQFENLTVKKIPKAVLKKCEWGHDDYSLEVKNLPDAPAELNDRSEEELDSSQRIFAKANLEQTSLFDLGDDQ
ncbi:MAG: site-specific DNA-methyltransferase, partial [Aridibacter famidurans]|nr:site-specific DNA-methyltransferase [Aridibacter famidurans]